MTEPSSWPPPPEVSNPLAAHDDFLITCIRNWTSKRPILRLQLAGKLREKTRLEFRSCLAIVNNFCDRHGILVPEHGLAVWSPILLPLVMGTMFWTMNFVLEQRHDVAVRHLERVMLTAEKRQADLVFVGVWVTATIINGVFAFFRDKKTRRQAAEAKAKFAK